MKVRYSSVILIGLLMINFGSGCASQQAGTATTQNQATTPVSGNSPPTEHAELSGTWEYTMTNERQEPVTGLLTIQRGGSAGYTGSITLNGMQSENEMTISKAQLNGSNFIYEGAVITPEGNIPFTMIGTIQGRNMTGQNTVVYKSQPILWQVKAVRK
jgi:hypothetical protein